MIWLALDARPDAAADAVRSAVAAAGADGYPGGHATLIRATQDVRAAVPVFEPQPEPLAALNARVKAAFDPAGVLNPGRMVRGD